MTGRLWVMALFLAGCPIGEDETPTGDTGTVNEVAAIHGTVGRTAPIAADGDGIGTLFVAALDVCSLTGTVIGVAGVPSADLSADGAEVVFAIEGLPRTTVYLGAFLDDDGNADPAGPLPEVGDLVYGENAGDGLLDCVAVDLSAGDDDGVHVDLNLLEE